MKTLRNLFAALAMTTIFVNTTIANDLSVETEAGHFVIEKSQQQPTVNKAQTESWNLKYDGYDQPIVVTLYKNKDCKDFVVHTFGFEIQYSCDGKSFGAKMVDKKYANVKPEIVTELMNRDKFLRQAVIVSGETFTDDYLVTLIACYLPELMKQKA